MTHWFFFSFDFGELEHLGLAEHFSDADMLTGGRSGWIFDLESLNKFRAKAAQLTENL